jgi:hypothetical protein
MTTEQAVAAEGLETIVRASGLAGALTRYGAPEPALARAALQLQAADDFARDRFQDGSVRLTLDSLTVANRRAPHLVRAFVEQLLTDVSPQMLVLVWRVLNGAAIGRVELRYELAAYFHMAIVLRPDRDGIEERYESDDISDSRFFHHFGVTKINGHLPVFLGFYPTWPATE